MDAGEVSDQARGPRGDPEMVPVYVDTLLLMFCQTFQSSMVAVMCDNQDQDLMTYKVVANGAFISGGGGAGGDVTDNVAGRGKEWYLILNY